MRYAWVIAVALVAGCAETSGSEQSNVIVAQEPQYAPGDPCKGVVPELCPR